jgi:hypothetical protein
MIIFILGIWGILLNRRNILIMLMSIELKNIIITLFNKIKEVFYPKKEVDPLIAIVSPAFDELEARDKRNKRKRIILEHIARFIDAFLLKMKNNTFILLLYELYLKRLFSTINRVKWHFDLLCTAIPRSKELGWCKGLAYFKKALVAVVRLYKIQKALDSEKDRKE